MNTPTSTTSGPRRRSCTTLVAAMFLWMLAATLMPQRAAAQEKQATIYMFGFSASFNDSTVYFTDIQKIEDAWVTSKRNFLMERDEYSNQLRNFLKEKGQNTPTCVTVYAFSIKDIAKKYAKLQERYTKKLKGNYALRTLSRDEFTYKFVTPASISFNLQHPDAPAEEPKADKKEKRRKKNG